MSTLEARIAKLETRQGTTAERTAFQLDDATLERIIDRAQSRLRKKNGNGNYRRGTQGVCGGSWEVDCKD